MASTNKTTNYELSQYVGSDKPSYLNDYNQDMSRIDLGIHAAKSEADTNATAIGTLSSLTTTDKTDLVSAINEVDSEASTANATAVQADGKADTNATAIGTLANLTTTAKTNLVSATNEVNGNVGTLANLNTTVKTDLVSATNEVLSDISSLSSFLNLTSFESYTTFSTAYGSTGTATGRIYVARNNAGTLCKIYGYLQVTGATQYTGNTYNLNVDTGLRPESELTINGILVPTNTFAYSPSITIKTNGYLSFNISPNDANFDIYSVASLIFVKDFGDN